MINKTSPGVSQELNTIAKDTKIKGEIESQGNIKFDGTLEGSLVCKGRVVIGESAKIVGKIHCKEADISGNIEGELIVDELLSTKKTAIINGDITYGRLSVEPGATLNGTFAIIGNKAPKPQQPAAATAK